MEENYASDPSDGAPHGPSSTLPDLSVLPGPGAAPVAVRLRSSVLEHLLPDLLGRVEPLSRWGEVPAEPARPEDAQTVELLVALLLDDTGDALETFAAQLAESDEDPQVIAGRYLGPAARAIGEAWCADEADFGRVTFAIGRLQRVFWRLAARRRAQVRFEPRKLALLAPTPGEQHTFGLSIVEDALRRAGWEVDCCRFGEETQLFRLAAANDYRFIGLSLSGEALLPAFASAIRRLQARSRNPSIVIVAGGSLVNRRPELAIAAGADLAAGGVPALLRLAERIHAAGSPSGRRTAAE